MSQNYFVCPRCGAIHDVDPRAAGETFARALFARGLISADGLSQILKENGTPPPSGSNA